MEQITLDAVDLQLLNQLQQDASLNNQALAELLNISPPTCLRRVKRLREALSPAQCAGMVETVRGAGYRLTRHASLAPT